MWNVTDCKCSAARDSMLHLENLSIAENCEGSEMSKGVSREQNAILARSCDVANYLKLLLVGNTGRSTD
jgi:hypothetical protein